MEARAKNKVISAEQAIALVKDGDVDLHHGLRAELHSRSCCTPHSKNATSIPKRPRACTLIMCAGAGDSKGLGTGRLHHEGLLTRVIAANFGRMPKVAQAAQENKIQGYNLPQGVISKLYRSCASGSPGALHQGGPAHLRRSAPRRRQGQRGDDGRHRQARRGRRRRVAVLQGDANRRGAHPRNERRSVRQPLAWRRRR